MRCQNGDLRIVNGSEPTSGLLEFCLDENWVGVCDTNWNNVDAGVACYQLGYSPYGNGAEWLKFWNFDMMWLRYNAGERIESNLFSSQSSMLVVNNVQCSGSETRLDDCPYLSGNCNMAAALQCYTSKIAKILKCASVESYWPVQLRVYWWIYPTDRWLCALGGKSWSLQEPSVGNSVQHHVECGRLHRALQAAGILENR